jgi:flagellar biosynthetic protein FliS
VPKRPSPAVIRRASREELAHLLLRGAARACDEARAATRIGDVRGAALLIDRTTLILAELSASLDGAPGEVAEHLRAIYEYLLRRLAEAAGDVDALDEVVRDLDELGEAWAAVRAAAAASPAPAAG